jgi:hypothetical protein
MAKRKRNRITAEEQRAFDARTKMIEEHLERRRREAHQRRNRLA